VRKLATLKQFALLIAVNPFVTGCGIRGRVKGKRINNEEILAWFRFSGLQKCKPR